MSALNSFLSGLQTESGADNDGFDDQQQYHQKTLAAARQAKAGQQRRKIKNAPRPRTEREPTVDQANSTANTLLQRGGDSGGPPEIDPADILYDPKTDLLGEGGFGQVFRGQCRGQTVAVKVPRSQALSPAELDEFRAEVAICRSVNHPNICLFMGACTQPGKLMMVSEFVEKGALSSVLRSSQPLSLDSALAMAKDVAMGGAWLHDIANIIHRDLKPANLMVDGNGRVKIADFGFSQIRTPTVPQSAEAEPRGSVMWMAPELLVGQSFDAKVDVYSFSLILYELVTRKPLYGNKFTEVRPFVRAVCQGERPDLSCLDDKPVLKQLIAMCWSPRPGSRPSFAQIVRLLDECFVSWHLRPGPLVGAGVARAAQLFWLRCDQALTSGNPSRLPKAVFVDSILSQLQATVGGASGGEEAAIPLDVDDLKPMFVCQPDQEQHGMQQLGGAADPPSSRPGSSISAAGGEEASVTGPQGVARTADHRRSVTSIEHFATLVRCFGPFFVAPQAAAAAAAKDVGAPGRKRDASQMSASSSDCAPSGVNHSSEPYYAEKLARSLGGIPLLCWMRCLAQARWMHFDASLDVSKRRLTNRLRRTFLVRPSHTVPDSPLTISLVNDEGVVVHKRIRLQPGQGWLVQSKDHFELIDDLFQLPACQQLHLSIPCEHNEIQNPY